MCILALQDAVLLLPTHLFYVGFGNYTLIGMDIKSIVKRLTNVQYIWPHFDYTSLSID